MHHGRLATSPRLQRALRALKKARGRISTRELIEAADICAVNSVIAELRANGADILCEQEAKDGQRKFYYTLLKAPETK